MIEKQLAGVAEEQEKGLIVVDPWIPSEVDKKNKGFFKGIFSNASCLRKKRKIKIDAGDHDLLQQQQ